MPLSRDQLLEALVLNVNLYWSACSAPVAAHLLGKKFSRALAFHGGLDGLLEELHTKGRVHRIVTNLMRTYVMPKIVWEGMNEDRRLGVSDIIRSKRPEHMVRRYKLD